LAHRHPGEHPPPSRAVYGPGGGPITESQLPPLMGGFSLTAAIETTDEAAEGIIAAIGDRHGGWAFYLQDGVPVASVALLSNAARVVGPGPLPPGAHTVGMRYEAGREPKLVVTVDGDDVAGSPMPGLFLLPNLSTSGVGLLIGRDRGLPVDEHYRPPFPCTAVVHRVELASA